MRGVLSVLGMDQASQAVLHMRDDVDALAQTEVDPQQAIQAGTFDRLADNLGALSFLIDMLSVQPQLAKSLFRFDPETGSLSAVMGQSGRNSAFAAWMKHRPPPSPTPAPAPRTQRSRLQPPAGGDAASEPASTRALLEQVLSLAEAAARPEVLDAPPATGAVSQLALAADQRDLARRLDRAAAAALRESPANASRASGTGRDGGQSGRRRARRTAAAGARAATGAGARRWHRARRRRRDARDLHRGSARGRRRRPCGAERLADAPDNAGDMTAVRRAFHTLKGSSRMVGLRDFGEAAWACEQLYNARLAHAPRGRRRAACLHE
jgi:chemosensory pili system protein ChpA (sensor histidine kinase/response regulator)